MAIYLNGCPVKLKQTKFSVCVLKYSDDLFKELRAKYKSVIFYRHKGIEILGFSFEQQYDSKLQEFVKEIDITDEEYSDFRKVLIKYAIKNAQNGDIIVLAGKGHEDYQEIKGVKYPMDERVLIKEVLEELKCGSQIS